MHTNAAISELEDVVRWPEKILKTLWSGTILLDRAIPNITNDSIEIRRENLASGLYFFQLQSGRQIRASGKLIME